LNSWVFIWQKLLAGIGGINSKLENRRQGKHSCKQRQLGIVLFVIYVIEGERMRVSDSSTVSEGKAANLRATTFTYRSICNLFYWRGKDKECQIHSWSCQHAAIVDTLGI
jgi:hypothetical protein